MGALSFIKRLLGHCKNKEKDRPQLLLGYKVKEEEINTIQQKETPRMKKFDIMVYSEDEGNIQHQHPEMGVCAVSAQQLKAIYAEVGERIQIIREYDDSPSPPPKQKAEPIDAVPKTISVPPSNAEPVAPPTNTVVASRPIDQNYSKTITSSIKQPPKYFNICGTECKFEDGKIYQKQWVKILGTEAAQYRIISDSNNREISLKGKHLEMLKWVLIQNDNEDNEVNTSIKRILNG